LNPVVSIIIPTKNRAHYLVAAIESVLNQSFRDFELLIIDGASIDNTQSVVASFSDSRIRYFRQEIDTGVSAARNFGIVNSTGEFIAFLDDDDMWLPEKLHRQLKTLQNNEDVGLIYSASYFCLFKKGKIKQVFRPKMIHAYPKILERNYIGNCSEVLIRRKCFDVAGFFDEDLPAAEDWDMWIRLSRKSKFCCLDEPSVIYRLHKKRLSKNPDFKIEAAKMIYRKLLPDLGSLPNRKTVLQNQYFMLGLFLIQCEKNKEARVAFYNAVSINPRFVNGYVRLLLTFFGTNLYSFLVSSAVLLGVIVPE
jgi:glycosyltransferase involved in cell wall biosynthesis